MKCLLLVFLLSALQYSVSEEITDQELTTIIMPDVVIIDKYGNDNETNIERSDTDTTEITFIEPYKEEEIISIDRADSGEASEENGSSEVWLREDDSRSTETVRKANDHSREEKSVEHLDEHSNVGSARQRSGNEAERDTTINGSHDKTDSSENRRDVIDTSDEKITITTTGSDGNEKVTTVTRTADEGSGEDKDDGEESKHSRSAFPDLLGSISPGHRRLLGAFDVGNSKDISLERTRSAIHWHDQPRETGPKRNFGNELKLPYPLRPTYSEPQAYNYKPYQDLPSFYNPYKNLGFSKEQGEMKKYDQYNMYENAYPYHPIKANDGWPVDVFDGKYPGLIKAPGLYKQHF